jgi:hypothetical protein
MKETIKDYIFILVFVLFPAFVYSQPTILSINNINNELRRSAIYVSDTTVSVLYDADIDFINIVDGPIVMLHNEDYMIILLQGNKWNFESYSSFFRRLSINELPDKKGTYVLIVCDDPNNPFYCNTDSLDILFNMGRSENDKFGQLYDKFRMCICEKHCYNINKYPEKVSNQYYQYHPYSEASNKRRLEITKDGLLSKFINEYIPTPDEISQYLKNKELQPSYPLNNTINIIREYYNKKYYKF